MANRFFRYVHFGENLLAYFSLLLLALFPFLDVIARHFFHSDVPNSGVYLVHLVLIATFLAGAVTSRLNMHLSLSVKLPVREPFRSIIHTVVGILCASITLAFAWSSMAFARNGFEAGKMVGIFPKRILLLVMAFGYLAMGIRFIVGLEHKNWRGLCLLVAFLLGSIMAFSSIADLFSGFSGSPPAFLASLQPPLQAAMTRGASPLIVILIISAFFGSPIFVVLGGTGYLLFARQSLPLEVIPNQAYAMLTGYSIAAIPLFAITGFLLSESKASERLIKLFRALFSWFPGGLAIVAILVCAFFTTFTGASGVTILALGGLLSYILISGGYGKKFTVGLLTASGSIGLLFPPSLPVIIYGVTAQISIKEMFKGGILPGLLLVSAMIIMGIVYALRNGVERHGFQFRVALSAFRESIWEILLPLIIFAGYFGVGAAIVKHFSIVIVYFLTVEILMDPERDIPNLPLLLLTFIPISAAFLILFRSPAVSWIAIAIVAVMCAIYGLIIAYLHRSLVAIRDVYIKFAKYVARVTGLLILLAVVARVSLTLVESAAIATIYVLIIQMAVHRDLKIADLPKVMAKCLPIIGGVLTILALANGLSYYIVDAEIPLRLTAWVQTVVHSKYVFLFILNLVLLGVGCLLDIYSAILVVVPLIIPLGKLFGINPVHLGIIFLANLELGYLTPPVGLNLYLSSYCFNEPVVEVARNVLKFLLIQLAVVLLITYMPFLTTVLLKK